MLSEDRRAAVAAAEDALREAAEDFAIDAANGLIAADRSSEAYFRDSLPTLADAAIDRAAPHLAEQEAAAAERERIAAWLKAEARNPVWHADYSPDYLVGRMADLIRNPEGITHA